MTEQKPAAWSYTWAFGEVLTRHDPRGRKDISYLKDVRPLYEHPPAPVDAKPVAWTYEISRPPHVNWILIASTSEPPQSPSIRNVEPLFKHPPAPAAPVTTPEVEAARRAALRHILVRLSEVEGFSRDREALSIKVGVLRDLVGRPTPNPAPVPPARLSVEHLAEVIAANGATRVDPTGKWVVNLAKAVHAAVYGGQPTRGEQKGDE